MLNNCRCWFCFVAVTCVLNRSYPQSITCPAGGHPNNLAPVKIWAKEGNQSSKIYRIGGNELKKEFSSSSSPDEIFLNSGALTACPAQCTIRLSTNLRSTDGMVLHQENVGEIPHGYVDVSGPKELYCARSLMDCGATAPIYRHKNETQLISRYAYSFDANEVIGGYIREAYPICYGWKERSSSKSAQATDSFSNSSDCDPLPSVRNGQVIYEPASSGAYSMGSAAILSCDDGYKPSIKSKIVCITGSWYPTGSLGECVPITSTTAPEGCAPLPPHENGHILYSQHGTSEFPSGTLAYLICNGHYRSMSTRQARCARGQWSTEKLGICQVITNASCIPLPDVQHGEVKYLMGSRTNITVGTVAELECASGYIVNGVDALICEPLGWAPAAALGTCQKGTRPCVGGLPLVLNGQISYSNEASAFGAYPSRTVAVLRCNIGYTITGAFLSTCEDSVWQPPNLGSCVAAPGIIPVRAGNSCPFGLATPIGGSITYSRGDTLGPYPSGTTATLDCAYGLPQGPTLAVCDNGIWIPSDMGACSSLNFGNSISVGFGGEFGSCLSDYPPPGNGIVVYSNGAIRPPYPSMTTANVRCNFGYTPTGTVVAICTNGQWSPTKATQCVRPGGTGSGNSVHGVPLGTPLGAPLPLSTATGAGVNFGRLPCGAGVATPVNGFVTYSTGSVIGPFPSGTVATTTCNLGFTAAGVTSSVCLNGVWSPPTPGQCVPIGTGVLGTGLGVATGGIGAPCPPVPAPINGQISYSNGLELGPFPAGTTATVVCNPDYLPIGLTTTTCINGVFSPLLLPQCVPEGVGGLGIGELPCIPQPEPANGQLTYSDPAATTTYASRTTATLICNLGFIPTGPLESTCINGQWQPPTLGICQQSIFGIGIGLNAAATQCLFEMPEVVNGHIRYSTGGIVPPFDSGTSATLVCNIGSTPIGATLSTCINGVWNPPVLGQCPMNDNVNTRQVTTRFFQAAPPIDCPVSPPIANGKVYYSNMSRNYGYAPGTVATLVCEYGFVTLGRSKSYCQGGIWSPWPGVGICQPTTQQQQQQQRSETTTASQRVCAAISAPANGQITYGNSGTSRTHGNGASARMECNLGYSADGNTITYCQNGHWVPQLGICRRGVGTSTGSSACKPLKYPSNGKVYYINSGFMRDYQVGSTAILSCDKGYSVQGQTTLTCSDTGWVPHGGFGTCSLSEHSFGMLER